ncbi:3',5'-cyclic nucleotide phosphodiesterase [Polynucleobacter sp. AP-Ainpum-60-G11]|uniref:3',5'-cyclic nucleotide phosphodiesterase n=1 Tax=Polynucleobacter sp. AP-Ainpum-60-G11 TaxID=2576926 RepID=UPI001BFDBA75|nr:3',5'-cyclic nucleotide phosphodiesterase [Polynucleobacter sp. AP-Ainpum-60-G11]QWE25974.1 hypothetical protein FD971_05790 [Polynucleobacter sp. AP-Ainpum-60-G11]
MPKSILNKALAELKTAGKKDSSGKPLDALESLFECSQNYQGNFRGFIKELIHTTFWESQNYSANPYPKICIELAALIDSHNSSLGYVEPAYHSRKHFQDVCLALTALLDQPIKPVQKKYDSHDSWEISREDAWLLLFCAIAHDFGHNGSTNKTPSELEKFSIENTRMFLSQSTPDPAEIKELLAKQIEPIILATDLSTLSLLFAKFTEPTANPTRVDCMSMLIVEADLLASALPMRGKLLGILLGQEWASSNPKAAVLVSSDQGRLQFLEYIRFISPHAIMLKMEDIRNQSIEQLKD